MDNTSDFDVSAYMIDSNARIIDCLTKMSTLNTKLLMICRDGKLEGMLSIGDIQRSILANTNLTSSVSEIPRRRETIASVEDNIDYVKAQMLKYRIEYMPILKSDKSIDKVITWDSLFVDDFSSLADKVSLPVVIMAGGVGSRLKPITNIIPKALVPINEKPIIQDIVDRFHDQGANRFIVSLNYKAEMIKNYFSEEKAAEYTIEYVMENEPRGTAGSLCLLKGLVDSKFILTNCDIVIDQDYSEVVKYHESNRNVMTVVSAVKSYPIPYGVIKTEKDGLISELEEKPHLAYQINTGMYVIEPEVLDSVPEHGIFHITSLIDELIKKGARVGAFPIGEDSWFDMGEWKEYQKTQATLSRRRK